MTGEIVLADEGFGEKDLRSVIRVGKEGETKLISVYYDREDAPDDIGERIEWTKDGAERLLDDEWGAGKVEETYSWDERMEVYV